MTDSTPSAQRPRRLDAAFAVALAFFFCSGGAGLLYQVVWTRKLVLLFGTTAYAVSTVLSVFFLGLALGSVWGGRLADRAPRPLRVYAWIELAVGAWAIFFVLAIGLGESAVAAAVRAAGGAHGTGLVLRALLTALFLLPPVTLMGATLPLLARHVNTAAGVSSRRVGVLYAVNTFGAVAGCALTGFVLIANFGYTRTTLIGAAINVVVGAMAFLVDRRATKPELQQSLHDQEKYVEGQKIGEILAQQGYVSTHQISEDLAKELGISFVRLSDREIPERIRSLIDVNVVQIYRLIPIEEDGTTLKVATADPTNVNALDNVARLLNRPVEPVLATKEDVRDALAKYYDFVPDESIARSASNARPTTTDAHSIRPNPTARAVLFAFALSGFCALALEVVWTRLLTIVFLGTTYSFTTMLTTVLCGIAAGGAVAALFAERIRARATALGLAQLLTGAACIAMLAAFPGLPERLRDLQSSGDYTWRAIVAAKFALSFLALFVPTFLFGLSFPLALRAIAEHAPRLGRDVGKLYAWNTFGGVAGAIAGGYILIPTYGTHRSIVALALLMAGAGLALVMVDHAAQKARRIVAGVIGVAAVVGAMLIAPADVSRALNESYIPPTHTMIHFSEGVEGTVVVSAPGDGDTGTGRVLWINAVQATASIEKGVKMNRFQGMLPFLFDRDIKRVLFMCFGSGVTAGTIGLSPVDRIDAVEISPDVITAAPLFAADNFQVADNPRVNKIVDDGRNFLMRTREQYDLITFEPMPLALAGVSTFYTKEYYELCRDHLTERGLVSQWIPLHNGLDMDTIRGLVRTFIDVFPESSAWFINADLFLIGSMSPLAIDYTEVERRLVTNAPLKDGLAAVYLPDALELLSTFFMSNEALHEFAGDAPIMTDDLPWAEFIAPRLIFKADVASVLEAITPLRESVLPLVHQPDEALRAALDRRHRAHLNDMTGLVSYYRYGPVMGSPEKAFRESLQIDPEDANAKYYLSEILLAKGQTYTRWDELDKALPLLEEARAVAPRRPDVVLALAEAYDKAGRPEDALAAYRAHLELGGRAAKALERTGQPTPPDPAPNKG